MPFPTITPTIPALVRSSAARFGDRPFLISDGQELTYLDVDGRSAQQIVTDALDQLLDRMPELDAMAAKAKSKG